MKIAYAVVGPDWVVNVFCEAFQPGDQVEIRPRVNERLLPKLDLLPYCGVCGDLWNNHTDAEQNACSDAAPATEKPSEIRPRVAPGEEWLSNILRAFDALQKGEIDYAEEVLVSILGGDFEIATLRAAAPEGPRDPVVRAWAQTPEGQAAEMARWSNMAPGAKCLCGDAWSQHAVTAEVPQCLGRACKGDCRGFYPAVWSTKGAHPATPEGQEVRGKPQGPHGPNPRPAHPPSTVLGEKGDEAPDGLVDYVEIVDPMGRVSYRRPADHPHVAECRKAIDEGRAAYTIRPTGERVQPWIVPAEPVSAAPVAPVGGEPRATPATPAETEKLGEVEALRAENARLRELMEDVASHLYVEGVDIEGGWQCVECGRPQPELKSYAIHVDGCSVGAFETALGYTPEPPRSAPSAGPSTVATKGDK